MRQFIREHPWRLEIVPGLLIIFMLIGIFVLQKQLLTALPHSDILSRKDYHVCLKAITEREWLNHLLFALVMVTGALVLFRTNHLWVQSEQTKKFCVYTIIMTTFLAFWGWLDSFQWLDHVDLFPHMNPREPFIAHALLYRQIWSILLIIAPALQSALEFSRRPSTAMTIPEHVPGSTEICPGDLFYYRETGVYWWQIMIALIALPISAVILTIVYGTVWLSLIYAIILAYAIIGARGTFIISKTRVTAFVGLRRSSILTTTIRNCSLQNHNPVKESNILLPLERRPKLFIPLGKAGCCLKIETIDNQVYIFGLKNAETACKLINAAIATREQSEGQA